MIKDYLDVKEAANYCCVSESQFRKNINKDRDWVVPELNIMGKKAYRVQDLRRTIEKVNSGIR